MNPSNLKSERLLPLVLFGLTAAVFWPALQWLVRETATHGQLLHGFIVFIMTIGLLVFNQQKPVPRVYHLGKIAINWLIAAYAVLVIAVLGNLNFLILPALALALGALLLYLLGAQQKRLIITATLSFLIFTAFVLVLPLLDWPLRSIAGSIAAKGLAYLGHEVNMGLVPGRTEPMLILLSNGRPFHVAPECNGFGMVLSSLLMACVIVFYGGSSVWTSTATIGLALLYALAVNALRIIVIISIAPHLAQEHYFTMHETVGILTTYGGLAALYIVAHKVMLTPDSPDPKDPQASDFTGKTH